MSNIDSIEDWKYETEFVAPWRTRIGGNTTYGVWNDCHSWEFLSRETFQHPCMKSSLINFDATANLESVGSEWSIGHAFFLVRELDMSCRYSQPNKFVTFLFLKFQLFGRLRSLSGFHWSFFPIELNHYRWNATGGSFPSFVRKLSLNSNNIFRSFLWSDSGTCLDKFWGRLR